MNTYYKVIPEAYNLGKVHLTSVLVNDKNFSTRPCGWSAVRHSRQEAYLLGAAQIESSAIRTCSTVREERHVDYHTNSFWMINQPHSPVVHALPPLFNRFD